MPNTIRVNFVAFRHGYLEYKSLQSSRRKRLSRRSQHTKGSIKCYLNLKKNLEYISLAGASAKHRL